MAVDLRKKVAIIGAAETDGLGVIPDMSMLQLHANAAAIFGADELDAVVVS